MNILPNYPLSLVIPIFDFDSHVGVIAALEGKFKGRITRQGLYIRWKDTKSAEGDVRTLRVSYKFDLIQYLLCPEMQFLSLPLR